MSEFSDWWRFVAPYVTNREERSELEEAILKGERRRRQW